jgi:hypothetical protein
MDVDMKENSGGNSTYSYDFQAQRVSMCKSRKTKNGKLMEEKGKEREE